MMRMKSDRPSQGREGSILRVSPMAEDSIYDLLCTPFSGDDGEDRRNNHTDR